MSSSSSQPPQQQSPYPGVFLWLLSDRQPIKRLRKTNQKPTQHDCGNQHRNPTALGRRQPSTSCEEVENGNLPHKGGIFYPKADDAKGISAWLENDLFSPIPQALLRLLLISFFNPLKNNSRKGDEQNKPIALRAPL